MTELEADISTKDIRVTGKMRKTLMLLMLYVKSCQTRELYLIPPVSSGPTMEKPTKHENSLNIHRIFNFRLFHKKENELEVL